MYKAGVCADRYRKGNKKAKLWYDIRAEVAVTDERRENYGRRATDAPGGEDPYVKKSDLPGIIRAAVRQALDEYEHECLMHLRPGDNDHIRDLIGAIREVGMGDLANGIVVVRENHKFVMQCHAAASKIGWGVIIGITAVMGVVGIIAVGMWQQGK